MQKKIKVWFSEILLSMKQERAAEASRAAAKAGKHHRQCFLHDFGMVISHMILLFNRLWRCNCKQFYEIMDFSQFKLIVSIINANRAWLFWLEQDKKSYDRINIKLIKLIVCWAINGEHILKILSSIER